MPRGYDSGEIGEAHNPETHLIPNIFKSTMSTGRKLEVFGDNYPTPDGSCVRDYVHVTDLAQAHLLSIEHMKKNRGFSAFNLGNGDGFRFFGDDEACERILNKRVPYEICKRREGDRNACIRYRQGHGAAPVDPQTSGIDEILASAWFWHKRRGIEP